MYYNKALYLKAINALKNYSFKRGSKADGQRNTLIALSYYELNDKNQAMTFLKKAAKNSYEKKRAFSIAQSLGYKI